MGAEEKRKKTKSIPAQGPGRMAQTPQAGAGDSASSFAVFTAQL